MHMRRGRFRFLVVTHHLLGGLSQKSLERFVSFAQRPTS